MRFADLQIGSTETKIENESGNIKFTDVNNSSGKLISQLSSSRYTEPDEYTYIHWKLDEEAAPYVNTGTAGSLNLTVAYGSIETYRISPFGNGNCPFFNNSCLSTGNTSVAPGNIYTVNFWYLPINQSTTNGFFVNKTYQQTGQSWANPFLSIGCYIINDDYKMISYVTTGAVLTQQESTKIKTVIPLIWNMITMTYDGANLKTYINGSLVNSSVKSGNVDYGNNGPWAIGNNIIAGFTLEYIIGVLSDIRIETTARSASYIETMYRKAVGLSI